MDDHQKQEILNLREILKILERVSTQLLGLSFSKDKKQISINRQKIDHLKQLLDIVCHIVNSISALYISEKLSVEQQSALYSIVQFIPKFIKQIWCILSDQHLANIKFRDANILDEICILRAKLTQTLIYMLRNYYDSFHISNERRFKIIFDNLDNSEFIIRLDINLNLEKELLKFLEKKICNEHQMLLVTKALEESYNQKRLSILQTLARQRILNFLAYPKDKLISNKIDDLCEIMPNLSKEQIHLCIRHFGYDFEKTLAALCEQDQLPFNLKILLRKKDSFEDIFRDGKKMKLFNDQQIVYEKICTDGSQNNFSDVDKLLNLLAVDEDSVELDGKILIKKTTERKLELAAQDHTALIKSSLKAADLFENDQNDDDYDDAAQKARDMKLGEEVGQSGQFNRLNIFATDNVYDDEYDDTYDHAQNYTQVDLSAISMDEKELPPALGADSSQTKQSNNSYFTKNTVPNDGSNNKIQRSHKSNSKAAIMEHRTREKKGHIGKK